MELPKLDNDQQAYCDFILDHPGMHDRHLYSFFPNLDKLRADKEIRMYLAIKECERLKTAKGRVLSKIDGFVGLKEELWEKFCDYLRRDDEPSKFHQMVFQKIYAGELKYFDKMGELYANLDFSNLDNDSIRRLIISRDESNIQ